MRLGAACFTRLICRTIRNWRSRRARFVALLRKYDVALVVADTAGKWPQREDVTADFMYLRRHGDKELYASGYDDGALARWASRIRAWAGGAEPADANRIATLPHQPEQVATCTATSITT